MRTHTTDTLVTEALRHLDPAPGADLTEAERERAGAAFARIVATPADEPVRIEPARPPRRRRLLLPAGLAGAAALTIPALQLGGGGAYASWTPKPETLTDQAAATAATTCRAALGVPDRAAERVAVAERRGGWTYVLLAGPNTEAICLMPNDLVGQDRAVGGGIFGTHDPDAPAPPTLAPDRIAENTSAEGSTDEGWFNWVEGYVGSDVTGVTVHTSSGPDIQASVVGDRFAAWWPGTAQSSHHPEGETWSYTVHLADGSTRDMD